MSGKKKPRLKQGLFPPAEAQVCGWCVFGAKIDNEDECRRCHRYPKTVKVLKGHWCGEFKTEV